MQVIGAPVRSVRLDVTDRAAVLRYAEEVVGDFGTVNVVINNAGIAFTGDIADMSFDQIERVMDVDFWGVVNGTKAFLPHLIASGDGHVVNISSLFGLLAVPGQSAYNAAKFAVRGFTEALRMEMQVAGHPVQVTCVHPGGIKTNIVRNSEAVDGQDVAELTSMFDKKLAKTSAEDAAAVDRAGDHRQPAARGRRHRREVPRPRRAGARPALPAADRRRHQPGRRRPPASRPRRARPSDTRASA